MSVAAASGSSGTGSESKGISVSDIKHIPAKPPASGFFYLQLTDKPEADTQSLAINKRPDVATLEYTLEKNGTKADITHTIAPPAFRGKGSGALLADAAFQFFRAANVKVIPTCSYISDTYLKGKGKSFQDMVDH